MRKSRVAELKSLLVVMVNGRPVFPSQKAVRRAKKAYMANKTGRSFGTNLRELGQR